MKKSIFLFFAAILCGVSAWAADANSAEIYYDNTKSQWSDVQLFIGKSDWNSINPMTKIANTNNLYCLYNFSWGGYSSFYFTTGVAGWNPLANNENVDSRSDWATCRSAKQTTSLGSSVNLYISTGTSKGASVTRNTITNYKDLNYKQTVQQQLTSDGTSYSASTEAIATVKVSSYKLGSATATSATSNNGSITSGSSSANCEAARTATVTYTVSGVNSAYTFVGWYDGDTQKSTSSTYTYQATEAKTITARFAVATEEEHEVTVTYVCGSNTVSAATSAYVGVETEKSFTAPTNITGYKFTKWTIGAGMTLKAGTENDATITVVTKSSSSDYTLVANYEEVMETVYFINTNKWARVNIHKWNGKAAASSWPGEKLTASGEKIGEYDVYSYTAKQGDYANVIFNSKTSSSDSGNAQTGDLTWTAGKYYIYNYGDKTGWYTKEEAEALLVVPVVEETVYFVNNKKWTKVQAYAWNSTGNNTWPGVALTATGEKVADYDVYSYTAPQGYVNVIFNNKTGDSGEQSADFVWTNGKYYCMGADANYAGGTQEDVETIIAEYALAANVYLAGEMTNPDNWDINKKAFKKATADATTATVTVALDAKTYKFKLVVDGAWKGNGGIMKRGGNAVHEGGWSFDEDKDCQIVADIAGDYTFTWNLTDKKLTVAYPPLPKYTVTATAENGSVTGAGEYEQGSEATLVATPDAGYAFKNWTKGGEEVSTEATYTFTVTANVELVANFVPEETHEVTVSYLCNATPIPGQTTQTLAVGVTTPSTITAPTIKNYKFESWTLGSGVQSEDATTANPIHITTLASGEYTLAANYTKIELTYTVEVPAGTEKCFIRGAFDGWDKFHEMELKDGETNVFTLTIDGAVTTDEYKYACQASWDYVEKKADGNELDGNRTWTENDVVAKWAEPAKCYLMGNGDWVNGVEMEYDSKNGQYVLLCHHIYDQFKFKYGDEWTTDVENYEFPGINWVDDDHDENYNITLPEGDYNFYFKKDSKKVYIETSTPAHTRTVPVGYYATVCLSQNIIKVVGATLFEVAGKEGDKVIFDEVLTPVAGMPYIFLAEENTISFYCGIETAVTPGDHKSLHGTFEDMVDADLDGMYMVQNNKIVKCAATGCNIPANRAYFDGTELNALGVPSAPMPGRRRITMGAESENTTTGVEGIVVPEGQTIKVISNGQLIIIRNGEMYNAQGVRF